MQHRRAFLRSAVAGGLVLVAGCAGSGGDEPAAESAAVEETTSVSMTSSQFEPRNVHVESGATLTWQNDASTDHTVTSASENWAHDAAVPAGETTAYSFEEAGVYEAYCSYHGSADLSGMSMKIAVGDVTIDEPLTESNEDAGVY